MFQVTFSDQCIHELNKLDQLTQMGIVESLSSLTFDKLAADNKDIGKLTRDGKRLYRLRVRDFRIYFDIKGDILHGHYFLRQHTLTDFVFRFKLPVNEEQMIEQHQSFWKYLESFKK